MSEETCLNSLGQFRAIYSAKDKTEQETGIEDLKHALQLAKEIDYSRLIRSCHVNLAEALLNRDQRTASKHLNEAKSDPVSRKVGDLKSQVRRLERRLATGC